MKTYLITGGAGFIGSNFVRLLLREEPGSLLIDLDALTYAGHLENLGGAMSDPRHVFIHGDVCDRSLVARIFDEREIDCVVHFAAESSVDRSIGDPKRFVRTNVLGTSVLLDCARASWERDGAFPKGKRFIQISTDEVYGSLDGAGYFTEETALSPRNPYSASKAAADQLAHAYFTTYGLPVNITRCSNNYGPCQHPEKLIPRAVKNAMEGREIPVYGDGMQVRDWLYVEDHCRALLCVIRRAEPGRVYNIGGRQERRNLEVVRAVLAGLRARGACDAGEELIRHVSDRRGHDRRYGIDPGRMERELGWRARISFEAGLSRTLDWYLDHRERLRG